MKARRRPKGGRPKAQVQAGVVERMGLICMSETSVPGSGSAFYYGMDVSLYPGDAAMQAWWNASPFCYTGFYLAPAPYHQDASWMSKRQVLINQGWGFMPVYVGRQADSLLPGYGNGGKRSRAGRQPGKVCRLSLPDYYLPRY